jgi:hypothetical protein
MFSIERSPRPGSARRKHRARFRCLPAFLAAATLCGCFLEARGICPDSPKSGTTYGKVRLPNFSMEATFTSQRPRAESDITIITQCSVDRLYMLQEQCKSWMGITSVAVYWPLICFQPNNTANLAEAISTVKLFHQQMDAAGKCRLDIVVIAEVIKEHDLWAYPYNALRNQALSRATTDVVLSLDADFLVSAGLHEKLSSPEASAALLEDVSIQRNVVVLPAFETETSLGLEKGGDIANLAQRSSKVELSKLFEARQVIQFAEFYPVGHRSTNYKKFFESDAPYPIKFKSGYEPYVLVSRKHMPWYDERFRGYGWDKVMQIFQLDAMNFRFMAHPNAFVVHRPHPPSSGYNHTFTGEAYTQKHKPTDHLWKMERIAKDMMAELKMGTYPEQGVGTITHCKDRVVTQEYNSQRWW